MFKYKLDKYMFFYNETYQKEWINRKIKSITGM
jgi:hypothetical protein